MLMLTLFDAANPAECYRRTESVIPQQALALANSSLLSTQARTMAGKLTATHADDDAFVKEAFLRILSRHATSPETRCLPRVPDESARSCWRSPNGLTPITGGASRPSPRRPIRPAARENLILALFNHNDCVTVR